MTHAPLGYVAFKEPQPAALRKITPTDGFIIDPPGIAWPQAMIEAALPGRLLPHPVMGPAMTEAFAMRRQGATSAKVADHLEEYGAGPQVPSVQIKRFRNRVYLGEYEIVRRFQDRDGRPTGETKVLHFRAENHVPLIDAETHRSVCMHKPLVRIAGRARLQWTLTGLLRCAGCRHSLQPDTNKAQHRAYACRGRHGFGLCPQTAYVAANALDAYVFAAVIAMDSRMPTMDVHGTEDLDGLRAQIAEAERPNRERHGRRGDRRHDRRQSPPVADLKTTRDRAEVELEAATTRETLVASEGRSVRQLMQDGTEQERRDVLGSCLDRIIVRSRSGPLKRPGAVHPPRTRSRARAAPRPWPQGAPQLVVVGTFPRGIRTREHQTSPPGPNESIIVGAAKQQQVAIAPHKADPRESRRGA